MITDPLNRFFFWLLPDITSHAPAPILLDLPDRGQTHLAVSVQVRRMESAQFYHKGQSRSLYCLFGCCEETGFDIVVLLLGGDVIAARRAVYGNAAHDIAQFWLLFAGQRLPDGLHLPPQVQWQEMKVEAQTWPISR